jgi:hypothetical protein
MREYYRTKFSDDLSAFMGNSPEPYFGHAWRSNCAQQLSRIPSDRRAVFLVCLYFTVLVDQAMYSHFQSTYPTFAALTKYPKFCHGLSQFQHNPREILAAPTDLNLVSAQQLLLALPEGMTLFVEEVVDFCENHLPQVSPRRFFDQLLRDPDVQIPLIVSMSEAAKREPVVIAFQALDRAVKSRWPRANSA